MPPSPIENSQNNNKNLTLTPSTALNRSTPPSIFRDNLVSPIGGNVGRGYKVLYECKYCKKVFRNYNCLSKHFERKHKFVNGEIKRTEVLYKLVVVNGKYIEKRIRSCRTQKIVFAHKHPEIECNHKKEWLNSCFLRICPKCLNMRKYRYIKQYKNIILRFKRISLLTLTHRTYFPLSELQLRQNLNYCVKLFLKQLKYHINQHMKLNYKIQYIRVLEVVDKGDGLYYYHFHFLIDMPYIPQETLSRIWEKITGNYIVHIKYVGNRWNTQAKLNYICKYLAKPQKNISYENYALYIYRTHFVQTSLDLSSKVEQKSYENNVLICPECGNRLEYIETIDLKIEHT